MWKPFTCQGIDIEVDDLSHHQREGRLKPATQGHVHSPTKSEVRLMQGTTSLMRELVMLGQDRSSLRLCFLVQSATWEKVPR